MDSYTYLGLLFNYNGNFCQDGKKLVDQVQTAMYVLYTKKYNLAIPVDLQFKLFDFLATPIILYCSEIWGFECISNIEKIHLQFCKRVLSVRSSTPSFMVYGELVRFPSELQTKIKMICFWYKLVASENK
jgi:hypothetical protein